MKENAHTDPSLRLCPGTDGGDPLHRRDWTEMKEDIAPRLAGARVTLEFLKGLVECLPFGGRRRIGVEQVGFMNLCKPSENLRAVTGRQLGQFFKNLGFAHDENLVGGFVLCKFGPVEDSRGGAENAEEYVFIATPCSFPKPPRLRGFAGNPSAEIIPWV